MCAFTYRVTCQAEWAMMSSLLWAFSLPEPDCVCLQLGGVTFGHSGPIVSPRWIEQTVLSSAPHTVMVLACVCKPFLVFLGAGPDCITRLVTRTETNVYHGGPVYSVCLF